MLTQRYSVNQPTIQVLLTWVKLGQIAIPEIQRPFVWTAVKVRNLLDSLFRGYPVGFLISWKNPDVKLKDGTLSAGKHILIDGQQRVTALMAALLGQEVITSDYERTRIRISFHPGEHRFEVLNPAIANNPAWIPDIAAVFDPNTSLISLVDDYCARNAGVKKDDVLTSILMLQGITNNQIGLIELSPELDIETVTEIFIRVNSEGRPLSQADFAMSKIAVNERYGGPVLRQAIDYFCHLAAKPEFYPVMCKDKVFTGSEFFAKMQWLKDENSDLYGPGYTDMLRVAFTSQFKRGRLEDLVALLSGRNFETRQYEERIIEESFARLKIGIDRFINETNFKHFVMIIRSAGFVDSSMIGSQNALNFAYILYLVLKERGLPKEEIECQVRRWFVMSVLTGRYSGMLDSTIERDIQQIESLGVATYADIVIHGELSDAFWEVTLPQNMDTPSASSPYFRVFEAAQIKADHRGFLSRDISVRDLVEVKSDVHHIFPRGFLKRCGLNRSQYNQIANYAVTQSEINIAIGDEEPRVYFKRLLEQCRGGKKYYGNISDIDELKENLRNHCIPDGIEEMTADDYPAFLAARRKLMAQLIRRYFEKL